MNGITFEAVLTVKSTFTFFKKNQQQAKFKDDRVPVALDKPQASLRRVSLGLFFLSKVDVVVVQQK